MNGLPGCLASSFGNVRARALATRLLSGAALRSQARGESRDPVLEAAANTGTPAEALLDREFLEFSLALRRGLDRQAAAFLLAVLGRNWVENLRLLCRPGPMDSATELPAPPGFPPLPALHSALPPDLVASQLPPGRYRDLLRAAANETEDADRVALDDRLLAAYWGDVAAALARLPAPFQPAVRKLLGLRADLDLLRLVVRLDRPEFALDDMTDRLPAIGSGGNLAAAERTSWQRRQILRRSFPGLAELPAGEERGAAVTAYEVGRQRQFAGELWRALRQAPFGLAGVLAALLLKELEIRNRKTLLSARHYRLSAQEVEPLLATG